MACRFVAVGSDLMILDADVWGYLGFIWCVAKLVWCLFRNDAKGSVIYGIATFAGVVITLNIGGVLNDYTWSVFGLAIFALHMIYSMFLVKNPLQAGIYAVLTALSGVSLLGLI